MPLGTGAVKVGPGTGIVEALAKNLLAVVKLGDAAPGTAVTIRHEADAGSHEDFPLVV